MSKKKDVPIAILEALQPLLKKKSDLWVRAQSKNDMLRFNDADTNSDFFFLVSKVEGNASSLHVRITYKPANKSSTSTGTNVIEPHNLSKYFEHWQNLLNQYEETIDPFEDIIISKYQKEFESKLTSNADDSDANLNIEQQLFIDHYLEETLSCLVEYKTDVNKDRIKAIENEIILLKDSQTTLTKQKVIKGLSKVFAMIRKEGLSIFKKAVLESWNNIFSQLLPDNR